MGRSCGSPPHPYFPMNLLEIANEALVRIRQNPLTEIPSIGDTTAPKEAQAVALHLAPCFRKVLSKHDWRCAQSFIELTPLEEDIPSFWEYGYAFPNDVIRFMSLVDSDGEVMTDYEVLGGKIYTDSPAAYVRAVGPIIDTLEEFPDHIAELVAFVLAEELSYYLSAEGIPDFMNRYRLMLVTAKSIDSRISSPRYYGKPDETSTWISSRGN